MQVIIPIHLGEYRTAVYDGIPQEEPVAELVIIEPAETGDPHMVRLTLPAGLSTVLFPRDLLSEQVNQALTRDEEA